MKGFISNKDIICDEYPKNKGTLIEKNDFKKDDFKSIG